MVHSPNADTIDSQTRAFYFEVPRSNVVFFQALFETYEGIATVRTLNLERSLVCVLTTASLAPLCLELLNAAQEELEWVPVEGRPVEAEAQFALDED